MAPFILTLLAATPCYLPNDATPGWKQVALPDDARSLAAPVNVEQFRTDELVSIVDDRSELYLAGESVFPGRTSFEFVLGEGGRSLEVRFDHPLRGAKVDVTAWAPGGTMTLMHEQRVGGERLPLTWGTNDVRSVTVRVHEHLREPPVVRSYRAVRVVAGTSVHPSPAFGLPRSLYYRQPVGAPVLLCDEPGRELTVPPGAPALNARPTPVSLRRAP
jgi:hypothetical protein